MRLGLYAGASTAAAAACLLKAFHSRPNYYSSLVYIHQSNACLLVITNLLLVMACSFMYGLQRLLYGPLRPIEMEQLSEKAWYAVLDTLLAMPSFREDVGGWLLTMFVLLLAGKVWGWIAEGRVDILEQQPPANPRLFHIRLATSLIISVVFDLWMLVYCIDTVLAHPRPGMMVIFTFEFAIQLVSSTFTLIRYSLSVVETKIQKRQLEEAIETRKSEIRRERIEARQNETAEGLPAPASIPDDEPIVVDENEVDVPGWEEKRRYLFAVEVFVDFLKLIIYLFFFVVSITFNGLPMHIMRDVYMTFASFSKRVTDYVAYRKATSDMNTRYPDATTEEIREDACIVCRENMVAWAQPETQEPAPQEADPAPAPAAPAPTARRDEGLRAKKLPCGHILHLRCLKAWLERQQVCPTCRRPVVTAATDTPGQPGGQAAQGAAPGAPPPPGQQRRNRGYRPRVLNLGPVRIGFLNVPQGGDQFNNIMNAAGAQQEAGQNPAQNPNEGPNHLGLQVPYLPNGQNGVVSGIGRSQVSTQVQLMQIEQRLIQEAHNLQLEQQQLATVRSLEAELARLRSGYIPSHQPVGTATAAQREAQGIPGSLPYHPFMSSSSTPEVLQGSSAQQIQAGHESLPQGLVLPEGWSIMPLQPAASGQPVANGAQSQQATGSTVDPTLAESSQQPSQAQSIGPTDDNGSPLFAPTPTARTTTDAASESSTAPAQVHATTNTHPINNHSTEPSNEHVSPWTNSNGGWTFTPQGEPSSTSDNNPESSSQNDNDSKGKGKAVEVEDAPDAEA